ncbi:MAG: hypothetical protein VB064_02890 [Oscillospiraceae bacterium]|nr:hypothetical protein [Oscillospiraceae bacterium]
MPDYSDFHFNTNKHPDMSDKKYREAIIEQAQKDQSAGKFQSESVGFRSLVKSYVSIVSPDRKNIIKQGLTAIFETNMPQPKTISLRLSNWQRKVLQKIACCNNSCNLPNNLVS